MKNLKTNKTGLAYVWGVAACTIIFFPIIYWVMTFLLDSLETSTASIYTFSGVPLSAWTLVKVLVAATPIFILIIVMFWSAVNAKAQSYEQ